MDASTRQKSLQTVKNISALMDSRFTGPFGIKFGLDAVIGLIPIFGDLVTSFFSAFIIYEAARAGCSPLVLMRMAINVFFENTVGLLPVLGNVFDIFWRANNRNVVLFERALHSPKAVARSSALLVGAVLLTLFAMIFGFFVGAYYLTKMVVELIANT